ncbi:MAG: MFS transporter [Candidatus Latescibacteria bacterium]|nr:MFS transporter [Candidatus Latescibacterota bacterium]
MEPANKQGQAVVLSLFLSVYLPALILSVCRGLLLPVMPLFARSFDVSYWLVGVVLAADGIGTLLADVPAGVVVRRLGEKRAMLLGVACVMAGVLGLLGATNLWQVGACRLLSGLGTALWNISRHTYLAGAIPAALRGRAIAVFGGIGRIGYFAGPVMGGFLAGAYGFGAAFLAYGILAVGALVAVLLWVKDHRSHQEKKGQEEGRVGDILRAHLRILLTAGSAQLCAQMVRTARQVIAPLYAADVLGLGIEEVGLIISIAAAVDMLMFYPAGIIMDRWGRKYASVPSFFIQSLGMATIPLAQDFTGLLLALVVVGLGNGIGSGTMMTLGADLAPDPGRGVFLGLWRFVGDMGGAASPLAVGYIADWVGLSESPLVAAGIGLAAAMALWLGVPETLDKEGRGG